SILLMLATALAKCGFNVEIAVDGTEGIKKFDEGHFDLVITDILMPGLGGNDVVKYVRNSEKSFTPVIGITGTPWLREDAYFDAVFTKPFSIEVLVDTVKSLAATTLSSMSVS
ncbi:MAG: response regulator, partial [Candidatus Desulfatibia sp.]|uniref:response regulator n=1 Tax=Candidatus Desulfatibia sp. TaxID=3101189 RepID=UPI002F30E2F9